MKKNDSFLPPKVKIGGKVHFVLFLLLMFTSVSLVHAQGKINVNVEKGSLGDVFKAVEGQTDYRFMYSTQDVLPYGQVTVQMKNATIQEILEVALAKTDLVYVMENNVIFIKKKESVHVRTVVGIKIMGQVVDEDKNPLPGVTVLVEGATVGTSTNTDGRYVLLAPQQKKIFLVFSFIGMVSQRIEYVGKDTINIVMKEDVKAMEEVVVTGYQTMRKRDVVGSVTTIKASDIMMPAYTSIDQMLQGRVAGMMVTNTSSRVGASPKIRIRGTSTILGNQDPLWVVDGVIQPDPLPIDQSNMMVDDLKNILGNQISWLNPADVETITVLKDASATAIYGSKAANGVIVITTKKGQKDRLTVNYSGTFTFRTRPKYGLFDLMDSEERIQFSREAFDAGAIYSEVPVSSMNTYEGVMRMLYDKEITQNEAEAAIQKLSSMNTDWFKVLTRNAFSHNHNLSISGGSEKVTYNASLGYSDQGGIELGNDAKNLSGRINVGVQLHPKVRVDVNVVGAIDQTWGYAAGVDPMKYATTTSRAMPAYDDNGSPFFQLKRVKYVLNQNEIFLGYNIENEMEHSYSKKKSSRVNGTLNFSWDVLPWLKYEFVGGLNDNTTLSESYAGEQSFYITSAYRGYDFGSEQYGSARYNAALLPYGGELYNGNANAIAWNIQNKVMFQKAFKEDHRINVLLGAEVSSTSSKDLSQTVYGYVRERGERLIQPTPLKDLKPIGGAIDTRQWGILQSIYSGGGWMRNTMTSNNFSLFATLVYSFKNRYVLNASARNDASNRFGQDQNKRFDPTYSFGVSWNVAEEPWLQGISKVLNQFTLRASYGIQGNVVNTISPELILTMGDVKIPYGEYISSISRLPNPDLSWERTKTWNFGVDIQLLQWITMNLEYYTKKSNNILNQDIALEYGRPSMEVNGGRIVNSGVEYSLNITPIRTKDWAWTVGLNSSKNWNEAKTQAVGEIGLRDYLDGSSDKVLKKGYDLSSFWSYSFKGLDHNTGYPEFNLPYALGEDEKVETDEAGNPLFMPISDMTDFLVYSGKSQPDFTGGLNTRLRWKGLTFGADFSLLLGAKKRLISPFPNGNKIPLSNSNMSKELLDRWQKPGDEEFTDIPGVYTGRVDVVANLPMGQSSDVYTMWAESDARVVNASFFRCQQMSLTWNANEVWCARFGLKSLSLNVIMNNVFVIADKKFHGFDPELGNSIQPKTYSMGINIGF